MEPSPDQSVTTHIGEPVHIRAERNSKGIWQLEVSIHGKTVEETLKMVKEAEAELSAKYPFVESG